MAEVSCVSVSGTFSCADASGVSLVVSIWLDDLVSPASTSIRELLESAQAIRTPIRTARG